MVSLVILRGLYHSALKLRFCRYNAHSVLVSLPSIKVSKRKDQRLRKYLENNRHARFSLVGGVSILGGIAVLGVLILGVLLQSRRIENSLEFRPDILNSNNFSATSPQGNLRIKLQRNSKQVTAGVRRANSSLAFSLPLEDSVMQHEGNKVVYADAGAGMAARYELAGNGVKEDIIFEKVPDSNVLRVPLKTSNLQVSQLNQTLVFYDQNGQYQYHFAPPFIKDAVGNTSHAVWFSLEKIEPPRALAGEYPILRPLSRYSLTSFQTLVITIDEAWLKSPDRVLPLTLDPTIVHDESSEFGGSYLRTADADTGAAPQIELSSQELQADIHTVALWRMENSWNDASGNGFNGTAQGGTAFSSSGKIGDFAGAFDGTDDYVTVSSGLSSHLTKKISVEAWAYLANPGEASDGRAIVSEAYTGDGNVQFEIWTAGASHNLTAGIFNGAWYTVADPAAFPLDTWVHVAATYDGNNLVLYVDGKQVAATAMTVAIPIGTDGWRIGRRHDLGGAGDMWQGFIDEVRISSVARTPEEIKAAAQRRPYGTYTSEVIDTPLIFNYTDLTWGGMGIGTGDGETASSSAGLIAQWNFNETSGTTAAVATGSCGSSCNGTLTNFANTSGQDVAPMSGWTANNRRWGAGALMFDGTNDYIDIPRTAALEPTNAISIEAWVNPSATQIAGNAIITKRYTEVTAPWNSYGLFAQNSNGAFEFSLSTNSTQTQLHSSTLWTQRAGKWTHVVGTYDGTTMKIYVNGKLENSVTKTGSIDYSNLSLRIGTSRLDSLFPFKGNIDVVRIYSRALPASEILSNYNATSIQFQTRTSADGSTWEDWKPTTGETTIDSMDNPQDWLQPSSSIYSGVPIATAASSLRIEGTGSLKTEVGIPLVDANTVGLWHLDETGGSGAYLKDSSGYGNHATPTGATPTDGVSSKARSFNGSNQYLTVNDSNSLDLTTAMTIETWIKPNSISGAASLVQHFDWVAGEGGPQLTLNNADVNFGVNNGAAQCGAATYSSALRVGAWHYIAATWDGGTIRIYVNGVQSGSTGSCSSPINATNNPLVIGYREPLNDMYFNGAIDEVRISNTARSAEEIAEAYRLGRDHYLNRTITSTDLSDQALLPFSIAADEPGTYLQATIGESAYANYQPDASTLGLWHLEEAAGSGAYLKDSSSNSFHGTPTGTTFAQGKVGKARYFNGTSDLIDTSNVNTNQVTVSAWTYFTRSNPSTWSYNSVISREQTATNKRGLNLYYIWNGNSPYPLYVDCMLSVDGNNVTEIVWYSDSAGSGLLNQWAYVTCTFDGSTGKVYINGDLKASSSLSGNLYNNGLNWRIGNDYSSHPFQGYIDEVLVSNVARTPTEIRQAYEIGRRTHPITIDFGASLDSGNLIAGSGDTSFTIDATAKGLPSKGANLFVGDKIVIKENYDGTEYLAQGEVASVVPSTGAITVNSWGSGSTFPSGGFTSNATVFKWQTEYWDLSGIKAWDRDAVTNLTLRFTDGNQGRSIWLDNLRSSSGYLTNPLASAITSTVNRYFQYRAIFSSSDTNVSAQLSSVALSYEENHPPEIATLVSPANGAGFQSDTPTLTTSTTDTETDRVQYKIELCTDVAMTQNCQTFDQTVTTTGWSASDYASGAQASYTVQTPLDFETTYFWRASAIDPAGSNTWGDTQATPYSFATNYSPTAPDTLLVNNTMNPEGLSDLTPNLSARYNDPDASDTATAYEIEVNTAADFTGTVMWDTGKQSMSPVAVGNHSGEVTYAGSGLSLGTTYYWRMRFWDSYDLESPWSTETAYFSMIDLSGSNSCVLDESRDDSQLTLIWGLASGFEPDQAEIERKVDENDFEFLADTDPDAFSYADTTINSGHTYTYRVRMVAGSNYSPWCTTSTLTLGRGELRFHGFGE